MKFQAQPQHRGGFADNNAHSDRVHLIVVVGVEPMTNIHGLDQSWLRVSAGEVPLDPSDSQS